jgi:hypothetical protein
VARLSAYIVLRLWNFSFSFDVTFVFLHTGMMLGFVVLEAAARALMDQTTLSAEEVATKAINVAADMCVYTNHNFLIELLDTKEPDENDTDSDIFKNF